MMMIMLNFLTLFLFFRVSFGIGYGEFPSIVLIRVPERSGYKTICAGAIINYRTVLTATHCKAKIDPLDFEVVAGVVTSTHIYGASTGNSQMVGVKRTRILPNYNTKFRIYSRDLMLIELDRNFWWGHRVKPARLPESENYPAASQKCWIIGWGSLRNLDEATDTMRKRHAYFRNEVDSDLVPLWQFHEMVGDSGGPIFCPAKDKKAMYLVGMLTTRNYYACKAKKGFVCAARIAPFSKWIKDNKFY